MTNRILGYLTVFLVLLFTVEGLAQTPEEILEEMDKVKLDANYLYGEGFQEDYEKAQAEALNHLMEIINEVRLESCKGNLKPSQVIPLMKELKYDGEYGWDILLYFPKEQAISMSGKPTPISTPEPNNTPTQTPNPNPNPNPTPTPSPTPSPSPSLTPSPTPTPAASSDRKMEEITRNFGMQDSWIEIKSLFVEYKNNGWISQNGAVEDISIVPSDAYSILIDEHGGVLAILSPKISEKRINYKTNQIDNEANYSNCRFIVWYK